MRILAIGTFRNEVDLVRPNVLHHLSQGVDEILIQDNGSTDGTPDALSDIARSHPVTWSRRPGSFQQDRVLTELVSRARERGADWVVPVDADEFWYAPGSGLRPVLARCRTDAARVQLVNFIQERRQRWTTPDGLLTMTRRVADPIGTAADAEALVEAERIAYVEHRYAAKWVFRPGAVDRLSWGSHVLHGFRGTPADATDIVCLHAPLRSFSTLVGKVDRDRSPGEIAEYFSVAWHLNRWRRLAFEGRLETEWNANSYVDEHLDVHGQQHPLVIDYTLRDLVTPWLSFDSAAEEIARLDDRRASSSAFDTAPGSRRRTRRRV
jgi:glycosyltransferase involved in cell wall biosynthesis